MQTRYIVIPNDTKAYRHAGKYGIYDTIKMAWINFRETEAEAYALLDKITAK